MDDGYIVEMYWDRNEKALEATAAKYGRYCYCIAYNILLSKEDADESVNDTYLAAWKRIPPHRPAVLATFLGKITRRISLGRWQYNTRNKRGGGEVLLALDELSECVPSDISVERVLEQKELTRAINLFLGTLSDTERDVFVSRYWFLASVREISGKFYFTESKTKSMLSRTRGKLRNYLQKEGLI